MKVRSCDFKIKIEKNYITLYLIAAKVTVKIHERRLLSCSASSDPEMLKISVGTAALPMIAHMTGTSSG